MLTARDRDLALLATLRAEREAANERERALRLAEARRWEEYLFTALSTRDRRIPVSACHRKHRRNPRKYAVTGP